MGTNIFLVAKYTYAAYGYTTITLNQNDIAKLNPFRFKSCYQDNESGMYCINDRYYIPEWGRWLTLDKSSIDLVSIGKHNPFGLKTLCPVQSNQGTELIAYTVPKNQFTKFVPHWEHGWFVTSGPDFFKVTDEGIVLVNGSVSAFKATFAFDENKERLIYMSFGSLGADVGANYDGIGLSGGANVAALGYDGKFIGFEMSMLTLGLGVMWKNGKLNADWGLGWFGISISIDFKTILEQLFGG